MFRIDTDNAQPNQNGQGKSGFSDNKTISGMDATYLSPDFLNAVQEEIANVIEAEDIVLAKGTNNQLLTAIRAMLAALGDNSTSALAALEEELQSHEQADTQYHTQNDQNITAINQNIQQIEQALGNKANESDLNAETQSRQDADQHLQEEIDAINQANGASYPRLIAGGYYSSLSNVSPTQTASPNWSHDISGLNFSSTSPAGSAAVNCSTSIDLSSSKYLVRVTGYAITNVPFGDSSSQNVVGHAVPNGRANGFDINFNAVGSVAASPANYVTSGVYFSWEVLQLTA